MDSACKVMEILYKSLKVRFLYSNDGKAQIRMGELHGYYSLD